MSVSDAGGSSGVERRLVQNRCALSRSGSFGRVLIAPTGSRPVALRGTGLDLWEFFATPHSESELVGWLAHRYQADVDVVAADVEPVVAELRAEGLLGSAP